jgi:Xaa-Pro aminopeptidase
MLSWTGFDPAGNSGVAEVWRPRVACGHPEWAAIEAAVLRGAPIRRVAADFGVAESSLRRHLERHVSRALTVAREARVKEEGEAAGLRLEEAVKDIRRLRDRAEREGDVRAAIMAVKVLVDLLAFVRKAGEAARRLKRDAPERWLGVRPDRGARWREVMAWRREFSLGQRRRILK